MKFYLSGKMTGLKPEQIWKNFKCVENMVKTWNGCESVMNPAVTYAMEKFDAFSYEDWLKIDFAMLDACDAVVLLPNWENSMGAKREIVHAWETGKKIFLPVVEDKYHADKKFTDGKRYMWYDGYKDKILNIVIEMKKHDIQKKIDEAKDAALTAAAIESIKENPPKEA